MIKTAWPDMQVFARSAGELDPYDANNAASFRGEEAFEAEVVGWRRWAKPSPEPWLDDDFKHALLASITRETPAVAGMIARLASAMASQDERAPLLVAVLRAGAPIGHLLAKRLSVHYGEAVPLVALSLFQGLGWDERALELALAEHPGRPVWFIDGWTSGGGVAGELKASFARWLSSGRPDFTAGEGPRLAVLVDPRGVAHTSAWRGDRFVPSCCFTAPETLGFSRGFANGDSDMFRVYTFPAHLTQPDLLAAWQRIHDAAPLDLPPSEATPAELPPSGWRVHINEVVRALINRDPQEVLFAVSEAEARASLAPVLHLCRLREVSVRFDQPIVADWGALAAARMTP